MTDYWSAKYKSAILDELDEKSAEVTRLRNKLVVTDALAVAGKEALDDLQDNGLAYCECVDGYICPPCRLRTALRQYREAT